MNKSTNIDPFIVFLTAVALFVIGIIAGLIFTIPEIIERERQKEKQEALTCESKGGEIVEIYRSDDICIKKENLISIKESKK